MKDAALTLESSQCSSSYLYFSLTLIIFPKRDHDSVSGQYGSSEGLIRERDCSNLLDHVGPVIAFDVTFVAHYY